MQRNDIYNTLVGHTRRIVVKFNDKTRKIDTDTYFVNLGASSCDRAEIVAETLESLSIETPLEDVLIANTVGEMVELIYKAKVC